MAAVSATLQENGISESSAECVAEGLRDGGYLDDLVEFDESAVERIGDFSAGSGLADTPQEFQHFMEGFFLYVFDPTVGCLSPTELTAFGGAESGPGSDPALVAMVGTLTAGCQEGSLADCDMLWLVSDIGSSAENVAVTCGDQNEPLDFQSTTCLIDYQSDSGYQVLVDECGTGFNLACDALYIVSIVGSEDETLATTCGGRREPNLTLPCWTQYGLGSRG